MSFLSTVGADIKKVFAWIGSPKGQTVVATAEGVVAAIDPALDGVITLANTWIKEAVTVESLSAAAGAQTGSGPQKAAAVISSITPQVLSFCAANNLPIPGATQIAAANTALVAFLNALGAPAPTA